jgi:hypothetical protein
VIPVSSMSVALAPHSAGARPAVLTLRVHYEMQCGWPGRGPLSVRLPAGMTLPARFRVGEVLVNGRAASLATSSSDPRSLAVALPARPQILCDAIGPGTLTVTFTRAARIGAPKAAGTYVVRASHGADDFAGRVSVTR